MADETSPSRTDCFHLEEKRASGQGMDRSMRLLYALTAALQSDFSGMLESPSIDMAQATVYRTLLDIIVSSNLLPQAIAAELRTFLAAFQESLVASQNVVQRRAHQPERQLSPREIAILEHVARGHKHREIGQLLGISEQTVKNHIHTILHVLHVRDRTAAVVYALAQGWISLPEKEAGRE